MPDKFLESRVRGDVFELCLKGTLPDSRVLVQATSWSMMEKDDLFDVEKLSILIKVVRSVECDHAERGTMSWDLEHLQPRFERLTDTPYFVHYVSVSWV